MKTMIYTVSFTVEGDQALGVILQATQRSKGITLASVVGKEGAATVKAHRYLNGIKNKGISADDLMTQILKSGKAVTPHELKGIYVTNGFAETTAQVSINKALRTKKAVRTSTGCFQKAGVK